MHCYSRKILKITSECVRIFVIKVAIFTRQNRRFLAPCIALRSQSTHVQSP